MKQAITGDLCCHLQADWAHWRNFRPYLQFKKNAFFSSDYNNKQSLVLLAKTLCLSGVNEKRIGLVLTTELTGPQAEFEKDISVQIWKTVTLLQKTKFL